MELKIYRQDGTQKVTVSPSDSSSHNKEVMADNVLNLSFTLYEYIQLNVNDYVDFSGERFKLLKDYRPVKKSSIEYQYDVKFYGIESELKKAIVLKMVDNDNNTSFSLTDSPVSHLQLIVDNVNRIKGSENWTIGQVIDAPNKDITYDCTSCFDALQKIAEAFGTEWWIENTTINLSRCEHGNLLELGYDKGLKNISKDGNDNAPFFTRLYPIGSTRNIDQAKYGSSRLHLPGEIQYVEQNTDLGIVEYSEEKAFVDIYPRRIGAVGLVRSVEKKGEDGKPFTIYYFTDPTLNFNPNDYDIAGLVKKIVFQSGELNGRDFDVNWHNETKEFEIITQFPYENQQLPGGNLIPKENNQYILYNLRMPDEYYRLAEEELDTAVAEYLKRYSIDTAIYKAPTDYIDFTKRNINLKIGRRVRLYSEEYFEIGYRDSRVISVSRKLNNPQEMDIGCSLAVSSGRISKIENNVVEIQAAFKEQLNKDTLHILKSWDSADPSEYNVFSSLRTRKEIKDILGELDDRFIRKDINDDGNGFYSWNAGWMTKAPIRSAIYNIGWEEANPEGWYVSETGTAWYASVNARGPILSNNVIGSPHYASGWTGYGSQWDMTKHFLETDYVSVRKELKVKDLIVDQVRGTNGSLAVSDTNKIDRVEDKGSYWRCYIDDFDGTVYMNLRSDDLIKCQRWEKTSGKYYLGVVLAVDDDWFDISKTLLEGSGTPAAGDTVIRWDNTSDLNRKGLLYLTSSDSYAPYMDVRYGDWDATVGTIKVRLGRLDGINDPLFPELYGAQNDFGLYTNNFYGVGDLILRQTGQSVSRTFEVLKDSITMGLNELREEVYVSPDSVLQNSTFLNGTTEFWEFTNTVYPLTFAGNALVANGSLFSDIVSGAQLVSDSLNNRTVMQITNTAVRQWNVNFNSRSSGKYAISFSYRPIVPYGSMSVGIEGSTMMVTVPLSDTSKWQRAEVSGDWDGTGDFVVKVTGGGIVNIVDISFADDRLTNAIATIKVYYDTQLSFKADSATMKALRDEYDEFNRVVRRDYATQTWTATKISTDVGTIINGKLTNYSTTSQTSTMINNKVADLNLSQYATTTWTSQQIKNSVVDLSGYATTYWTSQQITSAVKNKADKGEWGSDLTQTSTDLTATFTSQINGVKGITEAFYKFDINRMSLNRRIELGSGPTGSFSCQGGLSPNADNVAFWAGGTYAQAVAGTAKTIIYHDGTGVFTGKIMSSSYGNRLVINPSNGQFEMWTGSWCPGMIGFGSSNSPFLAFNEPGLRTSVSLRPGHISLSLNEWNGTTLNITAKSIGPGEVYKDANNFLKVR